ncbi:uncharacterized protein SPAPADRAFT_58093 [Spathaspora passalidarum NRRL Y-27907]|uniref:Uncharacterized protein n=1 Tax=Spathaspora passalidarum (strain NRRL Y-27907 / 11-Y1) TaxID=619300 RepID=G3AFI1_SPAPN|nr:uncharacterized protein SPAPADRAFT_58093 [Spathaspora passalidarum NRRL Y-27907]EGW34970.1 hypothetical protein SPAPADRAFT_58093 [Spathaspora passalidarum NRRL Y-27907]
MMKQDSMSRIEHLEQERDLLKQTLESEEKPEETEEITTDDVNTAINGFIMDLSRTPSVRETNRKKHEVDNSDKVSIELTPPVSDDEKEEESIQAQDVQNSNSTLDLVSAEISNTYSNDVEPFPKVHDQTHEEVVAVKKKFKLENEEFKQVRAIAIAISGVLIGYFIRRLTG